jgi:hypothetical protein
MQQLVIESFGMGNDEPPVKRLVAKTSTSNRLYVTK